MPSWLIVWLKETTVVAVYLTLAILVAYLTQKPRWLWAQVDVWLWAGRVHEPVVELPGNDASWYLEMLEKENTQ